MGLRRRLAGIAFGITALAFADRASAEETDHDRAAAAFAEARKLIEAGDCASAIPKLEESIAREPSIGARFSLADCTQSSDPYASFWHLREAALLAYVRHDDRLAEAEQRAAAIVARTGGLQFDIDAADLRAPGFELRVDDRAIDRFHLIVPIAAAPGDHKIMATVADGRRHEREARVTPGSVTRTRIVLLRTHAVSAPPAQAPPPPPVQSGTVCIEPTLSTQKTLSLIAGGAGIAGIVMGSAFGLVALEKRNELDRACNGDRNACTGSPQVVDPVLDSADTNAMMSTILFSAGAALVATGLVLWLTEPSKKPTTVGVLRW